MYVFVRLLISDKFGRDTDFPRDFRDGSTIDASERSGRFPFP
jgi:hypothetical protein